MGTDFKPVIILFENTIANVMGIFSFIKYKPPLPGKKTSTGSATPISSSAKSRQASSRVASEYSSPGLNTGKKTSLGLDS